MILALIFPTLRTSSLPSPCTAWASSKFFPALSLQCLVVAWSFNYFFGLSPLYDSFLSVLVLSVQVFSEVTQPQPSGKSVFTVCYFHLKDLTCICFQGLKGQCQVCLTGFFAKNFHSSNHQGSLQGISNFQGNFLVNLGRWLLKLFLKALNKLWKITITFQWNTLK